MQRITLIVVMALAGTGCMSLPEDLGELSDGRLVYALDYSSGASGHHRRDIDPDSAQARLVQEGLARGLWTEDEVELIMSRRIKVGMGERALIASWGRPTPDNIWTYESARSFSRVYFYRTTIVRVGSRRTVTSITRHE